MTTARDELPPLYDFATTERDLYARWMDAGVFMARADRVDDAHPAFVVLMPPPNVTAVLHVGHGLNNTVQDVLTRWRRMCGDEALWVPGTDHAGIATQNVVEKLIASTEGRTRFDLGREEFFRRTEAFVAETGGVILRQLRAIGASADWTRTAYTLSPELSRAVREAFVRLYEKGLIYRGHRVIHWCPRCLTSLSDEEAEFADETGSLYHIAYPVTGDPARALIVATTRPETMLGDVAVAVNPADERYMDLIGRSVTLPIVGIEIPIIADEYADPAFGTGVVKITPAHDANDFEVGRRHDLPMPAVISETGTMQAEGNDGARVPAELRGVDRFEARDRIVAMLRERKQLAKVESHQHAVRHCYRCDTVVEPRLSDQWFVRMTPLARPALEGLRAGALRILPERWEAVYVNWLEGIRDWNISRQLWWGHRIPVFYCTACDWSAARREDPAACPTCGSAVRQDEDVLDTWFSSWLWPLSTLGWPDENAPDLRSFYPTDMLVTAPEILFFWVARMIMAGYEFAGEAPFHTVYLHGTVRDTNHLKMSKSLGNGIDPLDVVRLYGADALRYTVIARLGMGADLILDPNDLDKSFAEGRNFATKLWNIGRFLLRNMGEESVVPLSDITSERLTRADHWILARLGAAVTECDEALGPARPDAGHWAAHERFAGLRLNEYAEAARRFVWNELADWYVESSKARLATRSPDRDVARAVLVHVFDHALRLLQPIVPFITDALWQRLPGRHADEFLARARWPEAHPAHPAASEFELVRAAVSALRQIRADYAIPPGRSIAARLVPREDSAESILREERALITWLTRCDVTVEAGAPADSAAAHVLLPDGSEVVVPLAGIIDVEKECRKLRGELEQLEKQLTGLTSRLRNDSFVARAPAHVVNAEREKEREWSIRREQLASKVSALCGR